MVRMKNRATVAVPASERDHQRRARAFDSGAFAVLLVVPSLAVVERYLGLAGVLVYVVCAFPLGVLLHRHLISRIASRLTARAAYSLAIAAIAILIVAFAIGYPLANSGVVGPGSDRDEALNIATGAFLRGEYPYYERTYLGNRISPLPGALVIAIPAVLLGNSAYQNLFWLVVFSVTASRLLRDIRLAVVLLLALLATCPILASEYVTGGDLLANSLYVTCAVIWLMHAVTRGDTGGRSAFGYAAFLGLTLASRVHFVLILPVLFSGIRHVASARRAFECVAVAATVFAVLTVPFYLYDPAGFAPLHTARTFSQFQSMFPGASLILAGLCGAVALLAAASPRTADLFAVLRRCALVLVFPAILVVAIGSIQSGGWDLRAAMYGMTALFFGAVGLAARWIHAGSNA
jgi:hypothetical protein